MKKTHKVVMLPTEKASRLWLRGSDNKLILENNLQHNSTTVKGCQHLYILSDEEIKEGDWFIDTDNTVCQAKTPMFAKIANGKKCKKIVATTDSLHVFRYDYLPQLPASFIQAYIKAYNEGKPITEVDLEMREVMDAKTETYGTSYSNRRSIIKTRPDNTVIIHQSKMYSRDEVKELCIKAWFTALRQGENHRKYGESVPVDKWIQENLY